MTGRGIEREQNSNPTEYRIGGQPLPIDEATFKVDYARVRDNQTSWILTARDRKRGEIYVLMGYAVKLLEDDFLYGSLPNFSLSTQLQLLRLPGCVGLSWGGHTADEAQRVLDKHVARLRNSEKDEFLIGLAGRVNTFDNGRRTDISIDEDELGIFRKLSKTGYRISTPPKPRGW